MALSLLATGLLTLAVGTVTIGPVVGAVVGVVPIVVAVSTPSI